MSEQNFSSESLNNQPASVNADGGASSPVVGVAPPNPFFSKKDLVVAGIIGFFCALLILPIAENLAVKKFIVYPLAVSLPLLSVLGMWLAIRLAQKFSFFYQLAKFVLVGGLNTFIDWGVLNLLMFLASVAGGYLFAFFKSVSFLIATGNSYIWNRFWTFKRSAGERKAAGTRTTGKELWQFLVVSVIGFALNVGIAILIVSCFEPQWGMTPKQWANIGAFFGTLAGLTWNFLGYKMIVFKD